MATYSQTGDMTFDYSSLKDRSYKAEDYNVQVNLVKGPLEQRRCTDVLWCIIFFIFLGGMGYMTIDGYVNGNPDMLLAPVSGGSLICGFDPTVEDLPYLYIPNITSASENLSNALEFSVCVNTCPTS